MSNFSELLHVSYPPMCTILFVVFSKSHVLCLWCTLLHNLGTNQLTASIFYCCTITLISAIFIKCGICWVFSQRVTIVFLLHDGITFDFYMGLHIVASKFGNSHIWLGGGGGAYARDKTPLQDFALKVQGGHICGMLQYYILKIFLQCSLILVGGARTWASKG